MNLTEFTLQWSNTWRFDYWWRKKHKIPFNSDAHRNANQVDMKMEYIEEFFAYKQIDQYKKSQEDLAVYNETGVWLKERIDSKKQDELFNKIDLSQF